MTDPDNLRDRQPGPLVLLADSQLLFASDHGQWLQQALKQQVNSAGSDSGEGPFAVYLGASNGNEPAFYQMACDALAPLGIERTLFLKQSVAELGEQARQIPAIILLAGGDPASGWQVIGQDPVRNWLLACRQQGSLLLGISAGAIHLTSGVTEVAEKAAGKAALIPFLDLYPVVTLVHEEQENWPGYALYQSCRQENAGEHRGCLKIPFGSGVWIDKDQAMGFGRQKSELIGGDSLPEIPLSSE